MGEPAGQCSLLGGPAALLAQLLLALIAVAGLMLKRHVERPQRPLKVWGLDVSKQGFSMLAAHVCGMLIALIAHQHVQSGKGAPSECAWYFVAFSFDTTLGLALTIALHRAALAGARRFGARRAASGHALAPSAAQDKAGTPAPPGGDAAAGGAACWEVLQACGDYGEPPSVRRWALQAAEWVACVVAARVLCGTLVVLLGGALAHVALGLDRMFRGHPTLLLYVVMIACPLCMNLCQVLLQDLVLAFKRGGASAGDVDAPASLAARVASLGSRGGSRLGLRVGGIGSEASLLAPDHPRSDAAAL